VDVADQHDERVEDDLADLIALGMVELLAEVVKT